MKNILALISILISVLAFGCGPQKDNIPVATGVITAPHQAFTDATLLFYEHGVKRWQLDTEYMRRPLSDTGTMLVSPVKITVYDSLGNLDTRILSDSGTSESRMDVFNLWGSVHIKNKDGMIVRSERLKWFREARLVTSDTFVQLETPKGDILMGRGMNAKDDFSRFSFMADVQGRFPDFKRRVEEEDEDFFK